MANDNDLASMTVSLPTAQKDYVKEQATSTDRSQRDIEVVRFVHGARDIPSLVADEA